MPSPNLDYPVNFGPTMADYRKLWEKTFPDGKLEFGFNAVAGYSTALVIEKALSVATSLDQLELRRAVFSLSGNLKTLNGAFALDDTGGQIGALMPVGQFQPDHEHLKLNAVYPHEAANGKPIYPRP